MSPHENTKKDILFLTNAKISAACTMNSSIRELQMVIAEVEKHIAKFPNACAVYVIGGLTDMIVVAKFKNRSQLSNFGKHTILQDPDGHLISIAQIESKSAEGFDVLGFLIDMGFDIQE
jgi:hypothetical protein